MTKVITQRDTVLFKVLHDYEFLTTSLITKIVFKDIDKRTALRRLRKLNQEKLIRRIPVSRGGEVVWSLAAKGASHIGAEYYGEAINRNSLQHDITLSEVRRLLELKGVAFSWRTEQSLRRKVALARQADTDPLIPDGVFAIKSSDGTKIVALELELNAKTFKRYRTIFRRYQTTQAFSCVWYLVTSDSFGKRLETEWQKTKDKYGFHSTPKFKWSLLENLLQTDAAKEHAHTTVHSVSIQNPENPKDSRRNDPVSNPDPLPHILV